MLATTAQDADTLELALNIAKEEWMAYVQPCAAFARAALRASHTHTSCAALAHAALPLSVFGWRWWRSKTKLFFKLTRSPDGENDDKLRRFLRLMNLRESDLPLLRFWTGGLSRPYRTQLLQRA